MQPKQTHWKYFMKSCEAIYFLGICIQLSCVMSARWLQKASFRPITTIRNWIKVEPHYVPAQGPPLFTKVSISSIDPADVKLPGYNQRVLNSVFKVKRIISYHSIKLLRCNVYSLYSNSSQTRPRLFDSCIPL